MESRSVVKLLFGFFLFLDLLPKRKAFLGGADFHITEYVRVSAHHFFGNALDHIVYRESAFFSCDLCVHDYLEEHIAEFLAKVHVIFVVDRVDDFAGLFDQAFFERLVGLLDIPRASAWSAQLRDDLDEIVKTVFSVGIVVIEFFVSGHFFFLLFLMLRLFMADLSHSGFPSCIRPGRAQRI